MQQTNKHSHPPSAQSLPQLQQQLQQEAQNNEIFTQARVPLTIEQLRLAATDESVESMLETFELATKLYMRSGTIIPKMMTESASKDHEEFKTLRKAFGRPELRVDWVNNYSGKMEELTNLIREALNDLAAITPTLKEYTSRKKSVVELRVHLVELMKEAGNVTTSGMSRTTLGSGVSAKMDKVLKHMNGMRDSEMSADLASLKQNLESTYGQLNGLRAQKNSNNQGYSQISLNDDIKRVSGEIKTMTSNAIDEIEDGLKGTPLHSKAKKQQDGSSNNILAGAGNVLKTSSSTSQGQTISSDQTKVTPQMYLEWHPHLLKSNQESMLLPDETVQVFKDMKNPRLLFSTDQDEVTTGLPRPYEDFEKMVRVFASALDPKTRTPRFKVAMGLNEGGDDEKNPGRALIKKILGFVSTMDKDMAVFENSNQHIQTAKSTLQSISRDADDILNRYVEYLTKKKITPKLRSRVTPGLLLPGSGGNRGGASSLDWPVTAGNTKGGGDGEVGTYVESSAQVEKKAVSTAPRFMYRKFDKQLARKFIEQVELFMSQLLSTSHDDNVKRDDKFDYARATGKKKVESMLTHARDAVADAQQKMKKYDEMAAQAIQGIGYKSKKEHDLSLAEAKAQGQHMEMGMGMGMQGMPGMGMQGMPGMGMQGMPGMGMQGMQGQQEGDMGRMGVNQGGGAASSLGAAALMDEEKGEKFKKFKAEMEFKKKKVLDSLFDDMKGVADGYEQLLEKYKQTHSDFMWDQHKDGFKYMTYWRNIEDRSEEETQLIRKYFEKLKTVRDISNRTLLSMRATMNKHIKGIDNSGDDDETEEEAALAAKQQKQQQKPEDDFSILQQWSNGMNRDQREEVMDKITDAIMSTEDTRKRISDMYYGKGQTLGEVLTSASLIVTLGLKLIRLLFLYMGLDYAERNFQTKYARQVYGQNRDPPHPFNIVIVALAIEFGLNLLLFIILWIMRMMFGPKVRYSRKGFNLDNAFFLGYVTDYIATTLILLLIAGVISEVISKKKYFRYRYEGERGIRALSSMTMSIAVFVFLIPFSRVI